MKRWIATSLCLAFLSACSAIPRVKISDHNPTPDIKKVCIRSIEFFSDENFSRPVKPSKKNKKRLEEARSEIKDLTRTRLKKEGFKFVAHTSSDQELHIDISVNFAFIFPGPVINVKTRVYHRGQLLFDILITGVSASSYYIVDIWEAQEKLADKMIKIFVEKVGQK